MKRYEAKLLNYIRRLINANLHEAEDVLQEAFIKVYENLNDFDQDLKFSSWIYRIVHNEAISHYRKNNRYAVLESDNEKVLYLIKDSVDIQENLVTQDTIKEVQEIIGSMPKDYLDVLVLRFFEEKNYEEISDILRKPPGTVATLLNRAKSMFKEKANKLNIKQ